jgi:hypothetical protein
MPYIKADRYDEASWAPRNAGELNFAISRLMIFYWESSQPKSYQRLNDISGAATEALAEFRRRVIVDYEQKKREANGDVYPPS